MRAAARAVSVRAAAAFLVCLAAASWLAPAARAQSGTVAGTVTDADSGDPIIGANVLVLGTTTGAATDLDGRFSISAVPSGAQRLRVAYVGYATDTLEVSVPSGGRLDLDIALGLDAALGEVVVSGQLEGQREAIRQQRDASQIVNVVSSDRIREVPDQNAVESIGRLPGISVQRNAGEGQKVVVRGLAPRFNNVTVNGQRIPGADANDRSVDLSVISRDALEGIEVYKSLTPDQDGDAIGGTVNLVTARAPDETRLRLDATTGYNGLNGDLGNYRVGGSASTRLLSGALGVFGSATAESADRGSRQFDAAYFAEGVTTDSLSGAETPIVRVSDAILADRAETRTRTGGNFALDYVIAPGQTILLNGLVARTNRNELRYRRRYQPSLQNVFDEVRQQDVELDLVSGSLRGEHRLFGRADLTWQGAAAQSVNRNPFSFTSQFLLPSAIDASFDDTTDPRGLPDLTNSDSTRLQLNTLSMQSSRILESNLTGQADLRVRYGQPGVGFFGYVKTGAKLRDVHRSRSDAERTNGATKLSDRLRALYPDAYRVVGGNRIVTGDNFFTGVAGPADFFDGAFPAPNRYDVAALRAIYDRLATDSLGTGLPNLYSRLTPLVNSYTANETVSAGYVMAEINIGQQFMVLPGIRYEHAGNDYTGTIGDRIQGQFGEIGEVRDTTGTQSYGEWLPMVQTRIRPTDWLDLRAAATRTLNRPDYFNLVPYRAVNFQSGTLSQGNPNLRHATAWNYDLSCSLFSPQYGLFTLGGFYKRIESLAYVQVDRDLTPGSPFFGFALTQPVNALDATTVRGLEVDVQTNLGFLAGPLAGVVFNANYARVWSDTAFPTIEITQGPPPNYFPVVTTGERAGPAPFQSDHIANASLGYDRYGFSGRVSLTYQSAYLDVPSIADAIVDTYVDDFLRWDLSLTQRIGYGLVALANVNNLTRLADRSRVGTSRVANEELFGLTANIGVRFALDR